MCVFFCTFAVAKVLSEMKRIVYIACVGLIGAAMVSCGRPSKAEAYRAQKHQQDSIALVEQERTLAYYQSQLEALLPQADSLLRYCKYEKNDKYQDHGYYVVKPSAFSYQYSALRVMVRDDGKDVLVYREGKRLSDERVNELRAKGNEAVRVADELQITIRDIKELEKRIERTSLHVQKYQKRLQKQPSAQ